MMSNVPVTGLPTVPPEYRAPWWAYALFITLGAILFGIIYVTGKNGAWWYALLVGLAGTYGLWTVNRCFVEGKTLSQAFDPHSQSWTMLLDGMLVMALAFASLEWRHLAPKGWYSVGFGLIWPIVAYVLGFGIYLYWEFELDRPNYERADAQALFYGWAKLGHDYTTFGMLAGGAIALCTPVLLTQRWARSPFPWLIILCVAIWQLVGGIHDSKGLDVWKIQDAYNWVKMHSVPGQQVRLLKGTQRPTSGGQLRR